MDINGSEIRKAMREAERKEKGTDYNKIFTLIASVVFIIGLFLIFNGKINITGLVSSTLENSHYCYLDQAAMTTGKIDCKYVSHDKDNIDIILTYTNTNLGSKIKITSLKINSCNLDPGIQLTAGKPFPYRISCPGITKKNEIELQYFNINSGIERSIKGFIEII